MWIYTHVDTQTHTCGRAHTCQVIDGKTFRESVCDSSGQLVQAEFDKIWPNLRVMGRSTPLDKHLLVSGLQVCACEGVCASRRFILVLRLHLLGKTHRQGPFVSACLQPRNLSGVLATDLHAPRSSAAHPHTLMRRSSARPHLHVWASTHERHIFMISVMLES